MKPFLSGRQPPRKRPVPPGRAHLRTGAGRALLRSVILAGLAAQTLPAQIPNSVLEESPISGSIKQAAKVVLPDAPDVGTNSQSLNFSPTVNTGQTSLTAPATPSAPSGSATSASASGGGLENVVADKAKDVEFDPANETFVNTKTGATWNVADNRLVDARFDRYLNQDAATQKKQEEFLGQLDAILQLLCPKNPYSQGSSGGPTREDYGKAYELLRGLSSQFPTYDNGVAATLANQVDALNAALAERRRLYAEAEKLESEMRRTKWNMDVTVKRRIDDMGGYRRGSEAEQAGQAAYAAQAGSHYARSLVKQQALQAAKVAQAEAKILLAKTEFQTLLMQHFASRRFQQVLIGGAFYRAGFGDGDMSINADTKLTQVLTDQLGVPLTVTALESATVEAIEDVRRGLNALDNMIAERRLASAEKRLQETLLVGENLPEMLSFPGEKRQAIHTYRQMRREAAKAIEVKDFERARKRNAELTTFASDHDPAPIQSAVAAAESASNLHLAKARNAATTGDKATAEAELKLAAEIWPQNPALQRGGPALLDQFDQVAQALKELDHHLDRADLRAIEEKREQFTAAVANDPARQARLRTAVDQLVEIERTLERAAEYEKNGSAAQAWQVVESLRVRYPGDGKLNAAASRYSQSASDYVQKITAAREAETRGERAKALALYLAATRLDPNSETVRLKIGSLAEDQLTALK